ncbi:Ectopic P granules protein 5 [Lunasporangiospora selenospora]|uniref:Ectopic P granules protein 5 n=1 Tax=Lunasporangiospora selenospora TaxID=979761 RepID=A0A9P6G416_9FUNG|nr:Ectopic P granules protein 5 [Lunasporangiospora selenospora]
MRSFESAHEAEQQSKLAIYNLQQKAKGYASKLWAVQSKSEIVTATCGDGATASHTYTFQYGHQEPEVAEKLKKTLGRMLKHRTRSLLRIQFEETTNRLWIQDHLVSLLSEFTGVNHHEPSVQQNLNPSQPGIQRIKKYIDILFQFERSARRQPEFDEDMDVLTGQPSKNPVNLENSTKTTSQSNMFLQSVQRWIIQLAAVLLHYGDFVDKEYLILHYISSPTIALLLEELALDDIQRLIRQPALVITAPPESNRLRQLLSKNPAEAVFLLTALSAMAATRSTIRYAADFRSDEKPLLDSSLSLLVVYLLLDVAYLHTDLRGDLSKPVREVLRSICDVHPRVISFILSFVDAHFEEMGDMTQYLFRELPLENWEMTSTDFKTLKQLLETPPLNSQKARFARQFLSSLHWTQDNSLDHHAADTIPDTIRQELAFSMADMNINYLINHGKSSNQSTAPPDESTVLNQSQLQLKPADTRTIPTFASNLPQAITSLAAHSGIHFSAEQERVRSFMDWCWSMLIQLELQNTPVISANEELRLHLPESSKSTGFLHGQHLFVSTVCMLLTSPSRDSGLFLKEGWKTLSGILQLNQGSVLLDLMAKLIPMAIFSDLELNAHAAHFGALLRDMAAWKQDPMFSRAGKQYAEQQHLSRSNVPPTMIALWSVLQIHLGHGRESDPSGINTKRIAQFWMSAVFSQKDWIARQDLVAVIDVVGKCCFEFGLDSFIKDVLIEQQILLSIEYRRSPGVSAEIMGLAQPSLDRVMDFLPERFTKSIPVPQGSNDPSLLIGTWSVKSFATSLLTQQANVETNSIWFAFYVLQVETHLERDMRIKIGAHYRQHPDELKIHGSIKNVMKATGVTSRKTLQNFAIWRWAQHLLILPYDTFLLPLFWQEFFHLYFGHVEQGDIFYGFKFLEMHTDVVEQLKARLHSTLTYFGQEARKAVKDQRCTTATHLTELHEFYIALYGWINEPLLLTTEVEIKLIRKDLKPERLGTCRLPDPLECSSDLWKDLLPNEHGGPVLKGTTGLETLGLNSENFPPISSDSSSPLKSPIELRSARKHSYSSPEHKIGNCLVKQAKQSPEISIQRPLMSPALITDTTSAQGLFGSPLRTIRDFCKDHQTKIESCEQLDASYLKELGSLYHNEIKISRLEIACSVTPNSSCQSPAIIERKYEEIVQNEQVKMSILENRERARALRSGRVDSGLCMAALELTKTVEQLLDRYTNSSDVEKESTRQLGIQSFYFIVQGLLDDARRYPPTLVILGAIVDTLGKNIVGQDSSQTEPILDLMKTDNFAIALLYKMFNPATLPKEFVKLYRQIANCKGYGLNSKDLLLRQFNVQAWACGPSQERPTVLDRLAFYEVAFTAMVSQQQLQKQDDQSQQATELSTKDRLAIIKSHRELAGTLFMNFLQQDYIEYLRTLFDTCGTMCLEPEALEDYIRILGVEPRLIPALLDGGTMDEATKNGTKTATTVGLSDYDLGLLVQFLVDYFNGCSEKLALGNLLDYYQGYAISIASLYTAILCEERYYTRWLVPSSTGTEGYLISGQNTDKHALHLPQTIDKPHLLQFRIWNDTYMIFQPWLSCLTDRAVDEHHFQGQQGGASRMMFTFVGVVFKMMDTLRHRYRDTTLWFAQLFEFYLDTMFQTTRGQGSINQIMLLHQHLRRLEWKHLEFSQSIIDRILEVRSALNVEARTEFWTYILTEVVDKDESDLRPRRLVSVEAKGSVEWHQTKAAFMRLGFAILEDMESVCGNDLEMRHQFLNVVWRAVIAQGDWTLISLQELYSLLESLNTRWDRTENWNDLSTPMGLLLYWLRMAVGLEGEEDQGSCLLPDRVLIYYGYMMQLLQARLASSAQDSLNVNFKLESIPLVITHLGHVLDVIAGSNSEPRHHGIHRPLLSLIGILNQCGKEPRSFLTAPATSPTTPLSSGGGQVYPFGAVYRGLKQMAFEVETIQLDVARAVCQRLNSIPVMVSLLEVAIEREFDLWSSQQGKGLGNGKAGPAGYPRSIFGLEKNTYFNSFSSMSLNRERVGFEDGSGRQSWLKIISQTEVPELSEGEFMDHGLSQGAVLTIYSRFLQRLKTCEANLEFDEILELGRELTETISKIHLQGAEPWKAHRSLLLVRMFLNLVAKESVNSVTQSRFLNSVRQLCRVLEVWCQDRDPAKGVLGSFGMGKRSTFDAKFRLVTRIIYTYLTVRLADKGISIYDVGHGRQGSSNNNGKSGALPWRKGRQLSEDRASESTTSNQTGNTGVSGTGPIKGEKDSSAGLLIETLAHLPTKNPDYAAVLVLPQLLNLSEDNQKSTVGSLQGPLALLPALAASPLDLVKKTIQPSSSPQSTGVLSTTPPAQSTSSCKPRQGAEGYPWHSTSPTTSVSPRSIQSTSSESQHHGHKRWSLPGRHHTRFSTGSTGGWDTPESSRYSLETSGTGGQEDHLLATGVQVGSRERNQREQEREQERQRLRMRLQYGTKNGTEDLEWAVEQIKDRRLRVLETAEFLEEVIERFYDGVGLFY